MAKTIINKCPNCGTWCEAEAKGLVGRLFRGWGNTMEQTSEMGGKLLGGIGEFTGAAVGTYMGAANGLIEAIAGDKFQFVCPECGAKWSTDDEKDDQTPLFNLEKEVIDLVDKFGEACINGNDGLNKYERQVQAKLNDSRNSELTKIYLYDMLAAIQHEKGETAKAVSSVNGALAISKDSPLSLSIKGYVLGSGRNASDAVAALSSLINYKEFSTDGNSVLYTNEQYHDRFVEIQNQYAAGFLTIPVEQRRFLYLVDGNIDDKLKSLPENVKLLPVSSLPTELEILGMPQDNTLYICHPYKGNMYIPASDYQLELIRDELHEFCHIMECLGAKYISLRDSHSNSAEKMGSRSNSTKASVGYEDKSLNSNVSTATNKSISAMVSQELSEIKEFRCTPDRKPYLPNDKVWYGHRQEWQRKVVSRLEGRLIKDVYTIATSHTESISSSKKLAVEAEVKALGAELGGGYEGESSFSIQQSESYAQQVEVEFYPLGEYETKPQRKISTTNNNLMTDEKMPKKTNWTVVALVGVIVVLAVILGVVLL